MSNEHLCIDAYKYPTNLDLWENCPRCGLKPKVWVFDNGASTACGCGKNRYNHFTISVESIGDYYRKNKTLAGYDSDNLRKAWNTYCETAKILY